VKDRFKYLFDQVSVDRLIILFACLSLLVVIVSAGQVRAVSIVISSILGVILFIRLAIYGFCSSHESNPDCHKGHEAVNIMAELANEMSVKLHPTKPLEVVPGLRGAKSMPLPVFSRCRVYFVGRVYIGCTILCCLNNLALKGILAHELAHLKKNHSVKGLLCLLVFVPVLVYSIVSNSIPITPSLLTLVIFALVFSVISWQHEYEADGIAAKYVTNTNMAHALEQVARLLYRPGDTLVHPSFKKRISRLLSDKD